MMSESLSASPEIIKDRRKADEEFCNTVRLHNINSIQSHGVLLVLKPGNLEIIQVSDNIHELFEIKPSEILNRNLRDFLTAGSYNDLKKKVLDKYFHTSLPYDLEISVNGRQVNYLANLHQSDDCLLLEIEFSNLLDAPLLSFNVFFQKVQQIMSSINQAGTIEEVTRIAAHEIKHLSGFDKVMIYSFDENWIGTVLAEAKEDDMESYFGLKFPATDIPKQARDLYKANPYRLIPNVDFQTCSIVPELNPITGKEVDLSNSKLRSVLPVHIEYLKNMKVMASMSTRIIYGESLWGLIACHHKQPKYLSFHECSIFEFLSNVISSRISSLLYHSTSSAQRLLEKSFESFIRKVSGEENLITALYEEKTNILSMLGADGIAICWNDSIICLGTTPDIPRVIDLKDWLKERNTEEIYHQPSLPSVYEKARAFADKGSGILVLPVQPYQGNFIIAFRPEAIRTINWGGNPNESLQIDRNNGKYHPRSSFQRWRETVKLTAQPWSEEHLIVASRLRNALVEHTLRSLTKTLEKKVAERTFELETSKKELEDTFGELSQIIYVATHDLHEPVRKIHIYGSRLREIVRDQNALNYLEKLMASSKRISTLLRNLLNYSRISQKYDKVKTDLNAIVREVLRDLELTIKDKNAMVEIGDLPVIAAVPDQMRQVFQNLVSNALQFSSERPVISISSSFVDSLSFSASEKSEGPYSRISITDNGIGFDPQYSEQIFKIFTKLHADHEQSGVGIGLAITRRIVEKHGGIINANSEEGSGATFNMILPV